MRLRIENLGPIREAELDLAKPLIMLTGPNNTGKTYLAWAAYSLARVGLLTPPASVLAWVDRLLQAKNQVLPKDTLWTAYEDVLVAIADKVRKQLPGDFAAATDRFADTKITLKQSDVGDNDFGRGSSSISVKSGKHYFVTLHAGEESFALTFHEYVEGRPSAPVPFETLDQATLSASRPLIGQLACGYLQSALVDPVREVLPVERLALNLFARELAARRTELVDEYLLEQRFGDGDPGSSLQQRAALYPRVIRDAIQIALRNPQTISPPPFADLADELETTVLGGRLSATDDEIDFTPHGRPDVSLRLHQTASVVKSLVSLVLFLRHRASPKERLIIDEPELNLHPDNQRRVARIIAKAVNRGLRVMMSTHSDYVIRELNNLIMLGHDSDEARSLRGELGYDADETLQPEQFGVYFMNAGGCVLLDVTRTGFEVETIDREIHRLNHDSQMIYQRLFGE